MRGRRSAFAAVLVLGLVAGGCGPRRAAVDRHGGPPVCEPGFSTPEGFRKTESFEDPYEDRVGIRLGFVSGDGRELHYFAGIPGEFGEGLPFVTSVPAASGIEGPLQGSGTTWVLSWRAPGPCGARAVLGSGFSQTSFLRTLEEAGIVPAATER